MNDDEPIDDEQLDQLATEYMFIGNPSVNQLNQLQLKMMNI